MLLQGETDLVTWFCIVLLVVGRVFFQGAYEKATVMLQRSLRISLCFPNLLGILIRNSMNTHLALCFLGFLHVASILLH